MLIYTHNDSRNTQEMGNLTAPREEALVSEERRGC